MKLTALVSRCTLRCWPSNVIGYRMVATESFGAKLLMGCQHRKFSTNLVLSTSSQEALDSYSSAVDCVIGLRGDPMTYLKETTSHDPDFGMAYILRGLLKLMATEQSFHQMSPKTREILDTISKCSLNPCEEYHFNALKFWAEGRLREATNEWEKAIQNNPRDILATRLAHATYFYLGDAYSLRDSIARVLPFYSDGESYRGRVLGMYAFGLEECHQYDLAEKSGRECIDYDPTDIWGVHAVAHCMEMQGRINEGIQFLRDTKDNWIHGDWLQIHTHWHLALYLLSLERHDEVLELYDSCLEGGDLALDVVDCASLLWRLKLHGIQVGKRWNTVAERAEPYFETHATTFNDAHYMMVLCESKNKDGQHALIERLQSHQKNSAVVSDFPFNAHMSLDLCEAIRAFSELRYGDCIQQLMPLKSNLYLIGGSHAQRDVFHQTLLKAADWSGRSTVANLLFNEKFQTL